MKKHYDVIVVGAGSMGMAAGYYLSRQGIKVLLIDAFDPPHSNASHHGDTRVIRHAYGEGREYVPLALRAQALWDDLEKKSYLKIFSQVGALGFGPKGESPFIDEAIASAKEFDLDIELLNSEEISNRWPGITIPENYEAFYEPNSGVLWSENCIKAYRELAEANGADFVVNSPVKDIEIYDRSVKVFTENDSFIGDKLIISGGAWNKKITASFGLEFPIRPSRQPVAWFECEEPLYNSSVFPAFMVEIPSGIYYGFPSFGGSGLKAGRHDIPRDIDPDTINRKFGAYKEDEGHIRHFLETHMPQATGDLVKGAICMYSRTADGHFIIDLHPKHSHVVIAGGFAGHGFKFASVVGEILSQLALTGETEHDISIFKIDRPALQEVNVKN